MNPAARLARLGCTHSAQERQEMLIGRMVALSLRCDGAKVGEFIATVILDRLCKPLSKAVRPIHKWGIVFCTNGMRQVMCRATGADDQYTLITQGT